MLKQLYVSYVTALSRTRKELFIRYIYVAEHLHFTGTCHSYITFAQQKLHNLLLPSVTFTSCAH